MSTVPAALGAGVAPGEDGNLRLSENAEEPRLTNALRAHPEAGSGAVLAAQAYGPLPTPLDRGLGQLVAAHADATATPSIESHRELSQTVRSVRSTLAGADLPAGSQVAESSHQQPLASDDLDEGSQPLADSLIDLYRALGIEGSTLDRLVPLAEDSAAALPEAYHDPLSELLDAQAAYQVQALETARALDGAQAGEPGDEAQLGSLIEASRTLRAQVGQTQTEVAEVSEATSTELEQPWTGPLGLIVVGTPGEDSFDQTLDGDEAVTSTVEPVEGQARAALAGNDAEASREAGASGEAGTRAQASAGTGEAGPTRLGSGWHMLVLDPGGDDVYQDNAAGVSAGLTLEVDAQASGPVQTVRAPLVDDGRVCAPETNTCEPFGAGVFLEALGQVATNVHADAGLAAPMSALVVDAGGDDAYQDTGPAIQAAARGPATGLLYDRAGDDRYEAGSLAQGASSLYGQALLVDRAGEDRYQADEQAQGFADLPDPALIPEEAGPFEGEDLTTYLARHTAGALRDLGGQDAYRLDDLRSGQGVQVLSDDYRTSLASEPAKADLVDAGGEERLPVPTRETPIGEEPVRPVLVNASGETAAQAWIDRPLFTASEDERPPFPDRGYKTAVAADQTPGTPIRSYGLELGGVSADCPADAGLALAVACALTPDDAPGVLVGSPDEVEDPPQLTISLTGNTTYRGDIATSHAGQAVETPTDGPLVFVDAFGLKLYTSPPAALPVPSLLVDVLGDDRYEGDDATIGYAADGGTALVVDVHGEDAMEAGNRSIAHAVDPASTAGIWDLDGRLEATSGLRSQAYARVSTATPAHEAPDLPAQALIELGTPETDRGQARLTAGNHSQAYSVGFAHTAINGTQGEDTYRVDGWGQGVHETGPELANACELSPPGPPAFVTREVRPTHTYVTGTGLFVDPAGDDTYQVSGNAGLGDSWTRPIPCNEDQFALSGETNANAPGLGLFLDRDGEDAYELGVDRPRPPEASNRSCQPPSEGGCWPRDDQVWATADESQAAGTIFGTVNGAGGVGYGIDGTASAQHLPAATCRSLQTYENTAHGFYELIGEELERTNCEQAVLDRTQSPAWAPRALLEDAARTHSSGIGDAVLAESLPTVPADDPTLTPRGDLR